MSSAASSYENLQEQKPPYINTLPHWLHMALQRIAEFARRELDTDEAFPCLVRPKAKFPDDWGCKRHDGKGWCLNCERSWAIRCAADWITEGMDPNVSKELP